MVQLIIPRALSVLSGVYLWEERLPAPVCGKASKDLVAARGINGYIVSLDV
jgi:hypothetical protein